MKIVIGALAVLLLAWGIFALVDKGAVPNPNTNNNGPATNTPPTGGTPNAPVTHPLIRVSAPLPNATVESPLQIAGEARGNWYFEASFPVKVLDAEGREIGVGYAQAEGEWMTTNFVPFKGTINFTAPRTETGTLVLMKDNPSGLPEHDDEVRIPVRFGAVPGESRAVKLYFYNESKDKDASGNVLCSAQGLTAITRSIAFTNTPIQDAVKELLKGPTAAERAQSVNSEFPLAGLSLSGASVNNGILTLAFNDLQNKTSGGSCRVSVLRTQIEATAKQFGGVASVRYAPTGVFEP